MVALARKSSCPKRAPLTNGSCQHLLASGCCALPDELGCVEWTASASPAQAAFTSPVGAASAKASPVGVASAKASPVDTSRLCGLTTDDIRSFKAQGVEVCLHSESFGELWLVPAYTNQARKELVPEHLATVLHALSAFPGSAVTSVRLSNKTKPLQETT